MVVWTPSQWERELDNFAARVRAKDYDRIPYQNWQTVFGFTKLNPSKKIVLAIDSTGKMTLTASNSLFNMNCYAMFAIKVIFRGYLLRITRSSCGASCF